MSPDAFVNLLLGTFDRLVQLTKTKGREYAGSADQLANFRRLSARLNIHPAQVLLVYLTKHLDSIETHIRDLASGNAGATPAPSEPIEGRIDDAILYLCLLKGLLHVDTND